jgi:hypothetical protein
MLAPHGVWQSAFKYAEKTDLIASFALDSAIRFWHSVTDVN